MDKSLKNKLFLRCFMKAGKNNFPNQNTNKTQKGKKRLLKVYDYRKSFPLVVTKEN